MSEGRVRVTVDDKYSLKRCRCGGVAVYSMRTTQPDYLALMSVVCRRCKEQTDTSESRNVLRAAELAAEAWNRRVEEGTP